MGDIERHHDPTWVPPQAPADEVRRRLDALHARWLRATVAMDLSEMRAARAAREEWLVDGRGHGLV